jgi:hypothetical protein
MLEAAELLTFRCDTIRVIDAEVRTDANQEKPKERAE